MTRAQFAARPHIRPNLPRITSSTFPVSSQRFWSRHWFRCWSTVVSAA